MTEPRTYFRDETDSDISGVVVLDTDDDSLRVTENRENGWCKPFWMPEGEFHGSVKNASTKVGQLPEEKHSAVVNAAKGE